MQTFKAKFRSIREISKFTLTLLASKTQRKHTIRWIYSLKNDYLLKQPSPWLNFDAIDFIKLRTRKEWKVFEYGSGGSTLFWLSQGASCVSIEHDEMWFKAVSNYMPKNSRIDYRFVQPELDKTASENEEPDFGNPYLYRSADEQLVAYNFSKYVKQIDEFADYSFDVVLIDGRSRPSCVMHSVSKIKVNGLLILDNSEREYYLQDTKEFLRGFEEINFYGASPFNMWMSQTSVYIKRE